MFDTMTANRSDIDEEISTKNENEWSRFTLTFVLIIMVAMSVWVAFLGWCLFRACPLAYQMFVA